MSHFALLQPVSHRYAQYEEQLCAEFSFPSVSNCNILTAVRTRVVLTVGDLKFLRCGLDCNLTVFKDMTPCNLVLLCSHLQFSTLKMEAAISFTELLCISLILSIKCNNFRIQVLSFGHSNGHGLCCLWGSNRSFVCNFDRSLLHTVIIASARRQRRSGGEIHKFRDSDFDGN
jgi:hypothetical protein